MKEQRTFPDEGDSDVYEFYQTETYHIEEVVPPEGGRWILIQAVGIAGSAGGERQDGRVAYVWSRIREDKNETSAPIAPWKANAAEHYDVLQILHRERGRRQCDGKETEAIKGAIKILEAAAAAHEAAK